VVLSFWLSYIYQLSHAYHPYQLPYCKHLAWPQIDCENESVKFTMSDPSKISDWVVQINESSQNLKRRSATLKKPSSNARPMRRQQIKNVIRDQKRATRGVKRSLSMTSLDPSLAPSPGKLRRFFNIPERLNEIVERLSPRKSQSPLSSVTVSASPKPKKKKVPGRSMSYRVCGFLILIGKLTI